MSLTKKLFQKLVLNLYKLVYIENLWPFAEYPFFTERSKAALS